jgi:Tfp pilus assembly protein PilX
VVLVVALILLVVIGISSAMIARSALFGGLASQNMRAQQLALQAAEIALRSCENLLLVWVRANPDPDAPVGPPPTWARVYPNLRNIDEAAPFWLTRANWAGANVLTVPAAELGMTVDYAQPPQCMAQQVRVPGVDPRATERTYEITAWGFSPDYQRDGSGEAISGAETLLQSVIRVF